MVRSAAEALRPPVGGSPGLCCWLWQRLANRPDETGQLTATAIHTYTFDIPMASNSRYRAHIRYCAFQAIS